MRKMKDSGVEWIGQIPSDWDVSKIKYLIKSPLQYGANESGIDYDERLPRYIRITDITMDNELKEDGKLSLDNTTAKPYLLQDEDILFARSGASVGKTFFYRKKFGVSAFAGYLIRASLNKKAACPKFVFYNTLGLNYENWKNQSFSQATIQNIGADKYNEYILPIPPLAEQQRIADFLDEKCSEIDSIRSDIQKQIDILNDYKKSVITEAVTKGLNPKAKLKDSGIEWIGKIPEGWDVKPNKRIMKKIKQIKSKYEGEPILSLTMNGVVVRDLDNLVGKRPASFDGYQIIKPGNLLMCLFDIDVTPRCIGLTKNKGLTSPAYSHFALENIAYAPYYYYYYLFLDMTKELLHLAKNLRHSLTEDDLGAIKTVIPPLSEQKAIASYLDEKCSEIDATIADKQKQLETLDEYKKSLIFEYVTGKKEVS